MMIGTCAAENFMVRDAGGWSSGSNGEPGAWTTNYWSPLVDSAPQSPQLRLSEEMPWFRQGLRARLGEAAGAAKMPRFVTRAIEVWQGAKMGDQRAETGARHRVSDEQDAWFSLRDGVQLDLVRHRSGQRTRRRKPPGQALRKKRFHSAATWNSGWVARNARVAAMGPSAWSTQWVPSRWVSVTTR